MKRMKKSQGIAVLCIMVAIIGFFGWYTCGIIKRTKQGKSDAIKLGLDLAGGVSITYQVKGPTPSDKDMQDTIVKLQNRIENDLGENTTTEANVYKVGDNRISVEIPGVKDANALLEQLGTPGNLYFIKSKGADGTANYTQGSDGYVLAKGKTIKSLKADGSIVVSGSDVKNAEGGYQTDSTTGKQSPVVQLSLDKKGTKAFAEATTAAAPTRDTIGIYYDGKFVSVPSVNDAITSGQAVITGEEDIDAANKLASYIRIGGLDIQLKEISSEVVGASLGANSLSTSLFAGLIGLLVVMAFMVMAYRILGLAADLALALYTELIVCILYWFGITLTLPGIAGIVLSIGMAVDANAIIFTRIKEEIGLGHSVASSIEAGFHKAMSAILDGNITTLIAAAVLGVVGTGTVKGFAITLAIGVVLSMFTALFISKLLIKSIFAAGAKEDKLYGRVKNRRLMRFIRRRYVFMAVSLVVICSGIVAMIAYAASGKKALAYSLEFAGGTQTTVAMDKNYTVEEINDKIVPVVADVIHSNDITAQAVNQDNSVVIKTKTLALDEREALNKAIISKFKVKESDIASKNISATIGSEMRRTSVIAVLASVFFMLIYIWFRFKDIRFGSSAIIALAHDVLVTLTMYALFRLSVGSAFIACILTVIGYSVNDTIVIFDRIRENLRNKPNGGASLDMVELEDLADRSISETFTRSLSTSFTTAVMVLMLLIFGVSNIREFAFPLLVGVVCGTYSSVCIATELWYMMKKAVYKKAKK